MKKVMFVIAAMAAIVSCEPNENGPAVEDFKGSAFPCNAGKEANESVLCRQLSDTFDPLSDNVATCTFVAEKREYSYNIKDCKEKPSGSVWRTDPVTGSVWSKPIPMPTDATMADMVAVCTKIDGWLPTIDELRGLIKNNKYTVLGSEYCRITNAFRGEELPEECEGVEEGARQRAIGSFSVFGDSIKAPVGAAIAGDNSKVLIPVVHFDRWRQIIPRWICRTGENCDQAALPTPDMADISVLCVKD